MDTLRFVFDENLVKAGRALCQLRPVGDMACFGHPPLDGAIGNGTLDPDWIPMVGDSGWVVITHDKRLRTRPREAALAVEHKLKVVHLYQAGAMTAWEQAVRVMTNWSAVESQIEQAPDGPWWLDVRKGKTELKSFQPGLPERG